MLEGEEPASEDPGAPAWMATFSDIAILLLTFFILLLSFANMDVRNFRVALGSVRAALGVDLESQGHFEVRNDRPIELSKDTPTIQVKVLDRSASTAARMRKALKSSSSGSKVSVHRTDRGVMLRIDDSALFNAGSDVLRDEGLPALAAVAELAHAYAPSHLSIEGHTDDTPIHTARFPSNWELSTARATAVLRYFTDHCGLDIERLRIAGYADIRPLVPNDTPEHRAQNRRVEFVFIKDDPNPPVRVDDDND